MHYGDSLMSLANLIIVNGQTLFSSLKALATDMRDIFSDFAIWHPSAQQWSRERVRDVPFQNSLIPDFGKGSGIQHFLTDLQR